jgi:hypothetical protein
MKKISTLILLTIFSFIYSCDKDETENADLIVGKWEYSAQYKNDTDITINECRPSTLEFKNNGYKNHLYYASNISGDCVITDNINSTWVKTGTNTYEFKNNDTGYIQTATVIFENGNKRLIFQNFGMDENEDIANYKTIYTRMN